MSVVIAVQYGMKKQKIHRDSVWELFGFINLLICANEEENLGTLVIPKSHMDAALNEFDEENSERKQSASLLPKRNLENSGYVEKKKRHHIIVFFPHASIARRPRFEVSIKWSSG